jgi:hypothetical protein
MNPATPPSLSMGGLLQRKCACGSPAASLTGQCEECKSKVHLQAKLTIGANDDPLEQEADRVADRVLAARVDPAVEHVASHILRYAVPRTESMDSVPAGVDRVLASSGRPLEPALKQDMEQRFGHDFSHVRVHTGTEAEQSARDVNAHAYTVGHNIVFASGQFAPGTHDGRRLIAHELAHVVQQSGSGGVRVDYSNKRLDLSSNSIYPATGSTRDANLIELRNVPQVIRRQQADLPKPTKADLRQMQLHELASRPGQALDQWKKLKQNERDIVVWEIIAKYGPDFALDFLKYAKGEKKRPGISVTMTNLPSVTTQALNTRGYRYAGDIGFTPIWVHPSGHEIWLGLSVKLSMEPPGVQEKCVDPCKEGTEDEEECKKCCQERIPDEDSKCRRACEFGCSTKL